MDNTNDQEVKKSGIPPAVAEFAVEERAQLLERIAELEAHCVRLGQGGAERYLEGRCRDADVEIRYPLQAAPAERLIIPSINIEYAARKLAECMDYPWNYMPEQGRCTMRLHAQAIIEASRLNPAPATADSDVREVK